MKEVNFDNFIIFLDVDGPLCSYDDVKLRDKTDNENSFRKNAIDALNKIIEYYNADLCMISGWNSKFASEKQYKEFLVNRGIKVNNLTFGNQHNRLEFILDLIKQGLKHYLIIDDEAHQYYISMPQIEYSRILQPNRYRCLDEYDFKMVAFNWKLNV
jgi:hypothetical protein